MWGNGPTNYAQIRVRQAPTDWGNKFFKSKISAGYEPEFFVDPGHIAHGDRYFAPLHDSNRVHALPRLYIYVGAHCVRFWGSWKGFGAHKAPPRRAFGALCGHDGRMECHQDFSIEFSNVAHYDRHIDACGVVSRLVVLPTRGGGPGP